MPKQSKRPWLWQTKPCNVKQLGNPGKRFGYRVAPGGDRLEGDFFTQPSQKQVIRRNNQAGAKWFHEEAKVMRKHIQAHEKEQPPVTGKRGPDGKWRPIVTHLSGSSLATVNAGCVRAQIPTPDALPVDTRYGKSLDFESYAQMNSHIDSYSN